MLRSLRAFVALVLVALALTGCVKIDMDLTIQDDDTVSGFVIFAIDKQVLTLGGKSPEEGFKDSADDFDDDLPKGSRSEVYDDGKFYGQKIIFEDAPLSEFNSEDDGSKIVHEDGKYIFTMDARMSADDLGEGAELVAPMLNTIEFKIAITFPGDVIEHDDHAKVQGRTVTWTLKMGDNYDLRAVSEEGDTFPWLLFAGVAGLFGILVVAGIAVLAIRMNRGPKQPLPAGVAPGAGATDYPTATYPTTTYPTATYPAATGSGQDHGSS